MSSTRWRGGKFNRTSIVSLLTVEKRSGLPIRVTQGGYNSGGVAASAGTHDGGGVIDISVSGLSGDQRRRLLVWLRRCGWAAWLRTPAQGFPYHIHAVRIGDRTASWGAKAQVVAYRNGRNGLKSNRADDGPRIRYVTWERSKYNPKNRNTLTIAGKVHDDIPYVSVWRINDARRNKTFSRHVYILEVWLSRIGYENHGDNNGRWSDGLQADLDRFRWDHRGALGIQRREDAGGTIGIASLTLLRNKAKSERRIREGK